MNLSAPESMYEFHAKELTQTEALRQFVDHVVKEIKSTVGWNTDVEVHISPEVKNKHLFSVSMNVHGVGQPIVVKKEGRNVMAVLRKVSKTVLRQLHRLNAKQISRRRRE